MSRLVVCDTGPLLHLSEAGAVHLLQNAGRILIPEVVATEFEQNAQGWKPPQWIAIHELDQKTEKRAHGWVEKESIDLGEAEAIALALQVKANGC